MRSRGVGIGRRRAVMALAAAAVVGTLAAAPALGAADGDPTYETTTTLTLNTPNPTSNAAISFTATVSATPEAGVPTGGVDFFVAGEPQGQVVLDADGSATVNLSITTPGDVSVSATYNGQAAFTGSSATIGVTVAAPPGSDTGPARPQLPEPIGAVGDPAPATPRSAPTAEPLPTELPNTGALTVPALLVGIAFVVLGLWCTNFARRSRRNVTLEGVLAR